MKQVLVTGAAGFIGCNFVRQMLNQHHNIQIISLDKLTYAGDKNNLNDVLSNPRHTFIHGDICDKPLVKKILNQYQIDTIVHFAAESHVDNSIKNPEIFLKTNIMGTYILLEEARRFWQEEKGWDETQCRFHHVSTDEVYGTLNKVDPAFTEETPYKPNSPYSASKASSDHFVRAYHHTYRLPVTTSNCSNNYGPYQNQEKLIPTVIHACYAKKTIPVYGDGSNIRDWLYVEDHCNAIDLIIKNGRIGEVYNIGGNNELDNITLVETICQIMDELKPTRYPHKDLIKFVADRKGHDWRYAIDNQKISQSLGFKPQGKFVDKLKATLNFYLDRFEKANKMRKQSNQMDESMMV